MCCSLVTPCSHDIRCSIFLCASLPGRVCTWSRRSLGHNIAQQIKSTMPFAIIIKMHITLTHKRRWAWRTTKAPSHISPSLAHLTPVNRAAPLCGLSNWLQCPRSLFSGFCADSKSALAHLAHLTDSRTGCSVLRLVVCLLLNLTDFHAMMCLRLVPCNSHQT